MKIDPYAELTKIVRAVVPNRSDEWYDIYLQRTRQYVEKNGDMAGAPLFPEDR